jgi:hypothetical protein
MWVDMKVSVQCQLVSGRQLGTDCALEFGLRRALAVIRRHDEQCQRDIGDLAHGIEYFLARRPRRRRDVVQ